MTRARFKTEFAYRVVDVAENKWHRFESTKPTIEQLNERIELHVQQWFADDDPMQFRRRANRENMKILNTGRQGDGVPGLISEQYGLNIYIDHWIREVTDLEELGDQNRRETERAALDGHSQLIAVDRVEWEEDIKLLRTQKEEVRKAIRALHPEDNAEEIERLSVRLRKLDADIKAMGSEALRKVVRDRGGEEERGLALSFGQTLQIAGPENDPDDSDKASAHSA